MQYPEELQARRLFKMLNREVASMLPDVAIVIKGAGVHWSVTASAGSRSCTVDCFDNHGYAIAFVDGDDYQAYGRTLRVRELRSALYDWLKGHTIPDLYERYAFVDRTLRFLRRFWQDTVQAYPNLPPEVEIRIDQHFGDFYDLWFTTPNRACQLTFYGRNRFPTCFFSWDQTQLFELLADTRRPIPLLVKRWVQDSIMPSALHAEFPWLDIGKLAAYYEAGRGIEGEFVLSWDSIEQFYADHPVNDGILRFLTQLRAAGFDRTLRAGQSLYTLILSRSRRHGLRRGQPWIAFAFTHNGIEVETGYGIRQKALYAQIDLTSEIEALLRELESCDID
jgi:hypothetical protein